MEFVDDDVRGIRPEFTPPVSHVLPEVFAGPSVPGVPGFAGVTVTVGDSILVRGIDADVSEQGDGEESSGLNEFESGHGIGFLKRGCDILLNRVIHTCRSYTPDANTLASTMMAPL